METADADTRIVMAGATMVIGIVANLGRAHA